MYQSNIQSMKRAVILIIVFANINLAFTQSINHLQTYGDGKEILLGEINKKGLTTNSFKKWFTKNYNNYNLNKPVTKLLKDSLQEYNVKVFLGTWCGDSKKEIPRFYKVIEAAKLPKSQLQVYAVDRTKEAYKQSPNREEKGLNIHRVPTFIFYKDGKEINRIVEHPKETIERDILNIVSTNKYIPNYSVVNYLNKLLKENSVDSLKLKDNKLVSNIAEFVKGSRELNTYGYTLLRSNQPKRALYIFNLNTKIFPYKSNTYDSLGEAYFSLKDYTNALKNYYKVLSIKPDDKNALEMIETIKTDQI